MGSYLQALEALKARNEHFKKGSIIPQRILKGKRKLKHVIVFGSNSVVVPTLRGYLVLCDARAGGGAIKIKKTANISLKGSPYHPAGSETLWMWNYHMSDEEYAEDVLKKLSELNRPTHSDNQLTP